MILPGRRVESGGAVGSRPRGRSSGGARGHLRLCAEPDFPTVGGNVCLGRRVVVIVGAIAGATGSRLVQYAVIGAHFGTAVQLIAVHNIVEAMLRPARLALAGDTGLGDSLPRSRPSFAAWSNVSMVAVGVLIRTNGRNAGSGDQADQ